MRFHLMLVLMIAPCVASLLAQTKPDPAARARALQAEVPLVDGHNDFPNQVRERGGLDLARIDISKPRPELHTDIPRLRQGGVGAQFWSVYVPAAVPGAEAVKRTIEQIDIVHRMSIRYPDVFEVARSADDIERIFKAGRIASLIGVEGGHSIDSSLGVLRMMYQLGARYMTLTHSRNVAWADSGTDEPKLGGLSPFGEEVVQEMNRLGMLVDLSHVSAETMEDAIRVSAAPVIFSHSSARAIADHPRNVPDGVLRLVAKNGGIVMVTFVPGFVSPEAAKISNLQRAEIARLEREHPNDPDAVERGLGQWRQGHPAPPATLAQVADHIDHIRKIAGVDHIGIGSDFDGIETTPAGLEDVSKFPDLAAELIRRGYSEDDVRKILSGNILRVMRAVEQMSVRLRKQRGPSPAMPQTGG
jgi:membrane dipeptidase